MVADDTEEGGSVAAPTYCVGAPEGEKVDDGGVGIEVDVDGIPVVICEGTRVASTALGGRSRMAKLGYDNAFNLMK
jgi:hypothetical protein